MKEIITIEQIADRINRLPICCAGIATGTSMHKLDVILSSEEKIMTSIGFDMERFRMPYLPGRAAVMSSNELQFCVYQQMETSRCKQYPQTYTTDEYTISIQNKDLDNYWGITVGFGRRPTAEIVALKDGHKTLRLAVDGGIFLMVYFSADEVFAENTIHYEYRVRKEKAEK